MESNESAKEIIGWEGPPIRTLGKQLHTGIVDVLSDGCHMNSRFLAAYPEVLIFLEFKAHPIRCFIYKGKLKMLGLSIRKMDPFEGFPFAFEISGDDFKPLRIVCYSEESLNMWVRTLTDAIKNLSKHEQENLSPLNLSQIQRPVPFDPSQYTGQMQRSQNPVPYYRSKEPILMSLLKKPILTRHHNIQPMYGSGTSNSSTSGSISPAYLQGKSHGHSYLRSLLLDKEEIPGTRTATPAFMETTNNYNKQVLGVVHPPSSNPSIPIQRPQMEKYNTEVLQNVSNHLEILKNVTRKVDDSSDMSKFLDKWSLFNA